MNELRESMENGYVAMRGQGELHPLWTHYPQAYKLMLWNKWASSFHGRDPERVRGMALDFIEYLIGIDKYDPKRGGFPTFLGSRIKIFLLYYQLDHQRPGVEVDVHGGKRSDIFELLAKHEEEFRMALSKHPEDKPNEVIEVMLRIKDRKSGIIKDVIARYKRGTIQEALRKWDASKTPGVSIHAPLEEGGENTWEDVLPDRGSLSPEQERVASDLEEIRRKVLEAYERLIEGEYGTRYKLIFEGRYCEEKPRSYKNLGVELGINHETVRLYERRMIKEIRVMLRKALTRDEMALLCEQDFFNLRKKFFFWLS